jgi:hypothetical protein
MRLGLTALCLMFLFFFSSCSTVSSGHYVQLHKNTTLDDLAKELGVSTWLLKKANAGRKIASGSWVFVPLPRGVLANMSNSPMKAMLNSGELLWPVPSSKRLSSKFGKRWGKSHEGVDIPARVGASILSSNDGVVVYSGNGIGGYGNITVISHEGGLFTVYAHAKKNFTSKGDFVYRGQVIAQVGLTGRTTGPHLHYEVRHDSKAVDPMNFISKSN